MGQTLKETALEYQAAGLCVLPAHSNRKCPALKGWGTYKDRLPTKHEVDAWFSNGVKRLCVVLGEVSGHAECLDFDCEGEKTFYVTVEPIEGNQSEHLLANNYFDFSCKCTKISGFTSPQSNSMNINSLSQFL